MPTFSVVIPTYNRAELLRSTLDSVAALVLPAGWGGEVLVVDNRSPDHTAAVVEAMRDRLPLPLRRVVEPNQGLNHARNRGMREALGDWLVYLDDDIKVSPGWLDAFADAVQHFKPDAVVGPVFPWFEAEPPPWCAGRVLDSVTSAYSRKGNRTHVLPANRAHELPGCNFAVRRALAIELGGFHPALDRAGDGMLAGGDFEFGMRLVRSGKRSVYAPGCIVEHHISRRKISLDGMRARWRGSGATRRALRRLEGAEPSHVAASLFFLSMLRDTIRSKLLGILGQDCHSIELELNAVYIRGYLFDGPAIISAETDVACGHGVLSSLAVHRGKQRP